MFRCSWKLALCLVPMACQPITYDHALPATEPAPAAVSGARVPVTRSAREPYTTYLEVLGARGVVGYLVRFDAIPVGVKPPERTAPEGAIFVEDAEFRRIGFITATGRAYRFRGSDADEVGQGELERVLPLYFDEPGLRWSPLR